MFLVGRTGRNEGNAVAINKGMVFTPRENAVDRADHASGRAPVCSERVNRICPHVPAGLHVGENVTATEAVNGLFGVADHDQAAFGLIQIQLPEYAVLNRIRVLKLINQRDRVTLTHRKRQGFPCLAFQGQVSPGQQVIERE